MGKRKMQLIGVQGQNESPLYIEWYSHADCDCYKIDLPWTKYQKYTLVLCEVSKGIEHAKRLAMRAIKEHSISALAEPVTDKRESKRDLAVPTAQDYEAFVVWAKRHRPNMCTSYSSASPEPGFLYVQTQVEFDLWYAGYKVGRED